MNLNVAKKIAEKFLIRHEQGIQPLLKASGINAVSRLGKIEKYSNIIEKIGEHNIYYLVFENEVNESDYVTSINLVGDLDAGYMLVVIKSDTGEILTGSSGP